MKGLYDHASKRLTEGSFRLRKWHTNDKELSRLIHETESSKSDQEITNKEATSDSYAKETLGMQSEIKGHKVLDLEWDCDKDTLRFDPERLAQTAANLCPTKRNILTVLSGLFDPLGIVSPITVAIKALFQELCIQKVGWDDELNESQRERWDSWIKDLVKTKVISFNRCLYYNIEENVLASYLHGFGDASNLAYCAVVYFVYESETETGTYVKMLTSKTRVAPLKPLTIPRLELLSARVLATLVDKVKKALEVQVQIAETRYWSDSKTALCWIENKGEWKQFVRHRVNDILKLTQKEDWGHCPGRDNPTDLGTRGLIAAKLEKSDLWWHIGPEWLRVPKEDWPERQEIEETPESTKELKKG